MDKRQTFFQLVKYEILMESPLDVSPTELQEFLKKFDESIQYKLFQNYLSRSLEEAMENPLLLSSQKFIMYWLEQQQQQETLVEEEEDDDDEKCKEDQVDSFHALLSEFESKKLTLLQSRIQSKLQLVFPICLSDDEHSYYLVGDAGCSNFGYMYHARLNSLNGPLILIAIMHSNIPKKQQELDHQCSHFMKLGYKIVKLDHLRVILFMNVMESDAPVILGYFKSTVYQQGSVRGSEYYRYVLFVCVQLTIFNRIKKRESRQRQRERDMQRKLAAVDTVSNASH